MAIKADNFVVGKQEIKAEELASRSGVSSSVSPDVVFKKISNAVKAGNFVVGKQEVKTEEPKPRLSVSSSVIPDIVSKNIAITQQGNPTKTLRNEQKVEVKISIPLNRVAVHEHPDYVERQSDYLRNMFSSEKT